MERFQPNLGNFSSILPDQEPTFLMFLDLDCLHRTEGAVKKIIEIYKKNKICLLVPYTVNDELERVESNAPDHVRELSAALLHTCSLQIQETLQQQEEKKRFLALCKSNARPENIDTDLSHVFEAGKYGARYFITYDKRLKGAERKIQIKKKFPYLELMTPGEFVKTPVPRKSSLFEDINLVY